MTDESETEFTLEQSFENAMEDFNFERVLVVMTTLNWEWFDWMGNDHVPSIDEMKYNCRHLWSQIKDGDYKSCASGGFKIAKVETEKGERVEISFIVSEEVGYTR